MPACRVKFPSGKKAIKRAMKAINEKYRPVHGPPRFVLEFLNLVDTPDTHCLVSTFQRYPHLFLFEVVGPFLIFTAPHVQYNNEHLFSDSSAEMVRAKSREGGVSFLTWVVHKEYLRGTQFEELVGRNLSPEALKDEALKRLAASGVLPDSTSTTLKDLVTQSAGKSHKVPKNRERDVNQPSFAEVDSTMNDEAHGKSLTNPFDLLPLRLHIDLLERIAAHGQLLCKQNCGFDLMKGDDLKQYLHLFYPVATVTLHVHHRLNQGMSDGERNKSVFLGEVRDCLSKNEDLSAWIAAKQEGGKFITRDKPFHDMLKDGSLEDLLEIEMTTF